MKKAFSCVPAPLCLFLSVLSLPCFSRPLTIGDAVPAYTVRHIVQYPAPVARLSDLGNEVLILDFMTSFCGSCLYRLPTLDSLARSYNGKVQIFPVTYESEAVIRTFLTRPYAARAAHTPFITQDSVLHSWFPHQYVSHMVWIQHGIVKAITDAEYVTAANINTLLRTGEVSLPVKRDIPAYDPSNPLLVPNAASLTPYNLEAVKYYSTVTSYIEGLNATAGLFRDSLNEVQRCYATNQSILRLYLTATGQSFDFPPSQIILRVKDTGRFVYSQQGHAAAWRSAHHYSYEGAFPLTLSPTAIGEKMRTDLNLYLNLEGRLEKRKVRCLLIDRPARDSLPVPPVGKPTIDLSGFVIRLNRVYGGPPVFTTIPPQERIYLPEPASYQDIPAIQASLQQHGIRVSEEERELDFLILTEPGFPPQ